MLENTDPVHVIFFKSLISESQVFNYSFPFHGYQSLITI